MRIVRRPTSCSLGARAGVVACLVFMPGISLWSAEVASSSDVTPATPKWSVQATAPLTTARAAHQVTPANAGQVLVTGGCSGGGCAPAERSAELLDLPRMATLPVAPMAEARISHVAAALPHGRVLVAGGWNGSAAMASAEVFEPDRRAFVGVAPMARARMDGTATPLNDGAVLVVGGAAATQRPLVHAEVFDPQQRRFEPVGELAEARVHHAAVRLLDGRVLVTGGLRARGVALRSAEVYDPATRRFTAVAPMQRARCKHAAVLLRDGRVMVIAGSADGDDRQRLAATEIYDPQTGRFTPGPALLNPRYKIVGAAAVLPGGEVVVAGDSDDVEVWVPGAPAFAKAQGGLGAALAFSVATPLPDGTLLVSGGYDHDIRATARTWVVRRAN